jgi:Putative zinc-finger
MSCASNETLLALHVEGDLPPREVAPLEAHLVSCERCATFRDDLRTSQSRLKSLGRAGLPEPSLQRVRQRTLAAVEQRVPLGRPLLAPAWRLVVAVAVVGALGLWSASGFRPHGVALHATTALTARSPAVSRRPPDPERVFDRSTQAAPTPHDSTVQPPAPVSPSKGARVAEPFTTLSPEDADQLARAVVEVARVERLAVPSPARDAAAEPAPLLVRLDTDDPSVVIYWQVDSNGG